MGTSGNRGNDGNQGVSCALDGVPEGVATFTAIIVVGGAAGCVVEVESQVARDDDGEGVVWDVRGREERLQRGGFVNARRRHRSERGVRRDLDLSGAAAKGDELGG